MDETRKLNRGFLEAQVSTQFDTVSSLAEGSDERAKETKNLETLYGLQLEEDRMNADIEAKKSDRRFKIASLVGGGVLFVAGCIIDKKSEFLMSKSTSDMLRNTVNRIFR